MTKLQGITVATDVAGYQRRIASFEGRTVTCIIEKQTVKAALHELYLDGDARIGYGGEMHIVRAADIISINEKE